MNETYQEPKGAPEPTVPGVPGPGYAPAGTATWPGAGHPGTYPAGQPGWPPPPPPHWPPQQPYWPPPPPRRTGLPGWAIGAIVIGLVVLIAGSLALAIGVGRAVHSTASRSDAWGNAPAGNPGVPAA